MKIEIKKIVHNESRITFRIYLCKPWANQSILWGLFWCDRPNFCTSSPSALTPPTSWSGNRCTRSPATIPTRPRSSSTCSRPSGASTFSESTNKSQIRCSVWFVSRNLLLLQNELAYWIHQESFLPSPSSSLVLDPHEVCCSWLQLRPRT